MMNYASYGLVMSVCAILSAKWAMELGLGQARQILWGIGGFIFGPLMLLNAYVYLVRKNLKSEGK